METDRLGGGGDAVLVIDDTSIPKKGAHSVGVAAQYASPKHWVAAAHARTRSKNYAYQNWKAHRSGALRPGYLDNPA